MNVVDPDSGGNVELYSESDALLIGNWDYSSGWPKLRNVPAELASLRIALEGHGFHVIIYENLTASDFRDAVENFITLYGYRKMARIVIYVAGHGATRMDQEGSGSRQVGYVIPFDAPREPAPSSSETERRAFVTKLVRLTQFIEWAQAMEAKHVLMIFDSCFSGAILGHRGEPKIESMTPHYVVSEKASQPLRWLITAGTATQTVPAVSIFNQLLVQTLSGERPEAVASRNGFLTSQELVNYLEKNVPEYNSAQTPDDGKLRDPLFDAGDMIFKLPSGGHQALADKVFEERASGKLLPVGSTLNANGDKHKDNLDKSKSATVAEITQFSQYATNSGRVKDLEQEKKLGETFAHLEGSSPFLRDTARRTLTEMLSNSGPELVSEVIRGLPHGSDTYKAEVAKALAASKGWMSADPKFSEHLIENAKSATNDKKIKEKLDTALSSMGSIPAVVGGVPRIAATPQSCGGVPCVAVLPQFPSFALPRL